MHTLQASSSILSSGNFLSRAHFAECKQRDSKKNNVASDGNSPRQAGGPNWADHSAGSEEEKGSHVGCPAPCTGATATASTVSIENPGSDAPPIFPVRSESTVCRIFTWLLYAGRSWRRPWSHSCPGCDWILMNTCDITVCTAIGAI